MLFSLLVQPETRFLLKSQPLLGSFSLNGAHSSPDYERRRGSAASTGAVSHSSNAHMRAAASVDRLNLMGEGSSGRKLPSMPDSIQRSPMKISGREGEIAALKRSNRRSASSHNLVNNTDGKQLHLFITNYCALDKIYIFFISVDLYDSLSPFVP